MELLDHASTSGHLLATCSLEITAVVNPATATQASFAHVIMETLIPLLLSWAMTFCESTRIKSNWGGSHRNCFYPDALLWDGQVCEGGGTCCQFNNPPWFTKNLTTPTTDSIELRLCLYESNYWCDVALELLELYIQ